MTPSQTQWEWVRLLAISLRDAGVRRVISSPGSRSTPLLLAFLETPGVEVVSVRDERSAAFMAVGQGRVTGEPSVLLCTSGSAGFHYFPAVVEAASASTPLLIITADRPPELQEVHAPQTVDQRNIFGAYARWYHDLGIPEAQDDALRGLRRKAAQAVFRTRSPEAGPVHLNAPLRKPLEPPAPSQEADPPRRDTLEAILSTPVTTAFPPASRPDPDALRQLAERLRAARRPLVIAGPDTTALASRDSSASVAALAAQCRVPVLPESTSSAGLGTATPWLFRHGGLFLNEALSRDGQDLAPDFILQLGLPPASIQTNAALKALRKVERWGAGPDDWVDPQNAARSLVVATSDALCRALAKTLGTLQPDATWLGTLSRFETALQTSLDERTREDPMTELHAMRRVVEGLLPDSLLVIGNSMPVRDLEFVARFATAPVQVAHQRGASGIDGLISGAWGSAEVFPGPVTLVLGDVSFFHDLQGLALLRERAWPLVIVVINNGGGRIFELLPLARRTEYAADLEAHWVTRHAFDFSAAAAAFGVAHLRARTSEELREALAKANSGTAPTVIEAIIDADATGSAHRSLRHDVARVMDTILTRKDI